MSTTNLSIEQEQTVQLMLSGKNVFLTGKAGTGKSTVIEEFKRRGNKKMVCLAPTGIAALNIEGSTIHRFFGFPFMVNDFVCQESASNKSLMFDAVEVILIDEISMVRSDLFAAIDKTLRLAASGMAAQLPFGGKQIIVVGDFSQLPPVVSNWHVQAYLENTYGGIYAFQTTSWRFASFQIALLSEIFRQRDMALLNIVNVIRNGAMDLFAGFTLEQLNTRCLPLNDLSDTTICLCSHHYIAAKINNLATQKLPDTGKIFIGKTVGEFPVDDRPTDANLLIKTGMRVMLLANQIDRTTSCAYANGMIGTVVNYGNDFDRPYVTVKFNDGREETINVYTWTNYEYTLEQDGQGNIDLTQTPIGTFAQLPIIPAYGITIHKSQGMTLTDPVCLMLHWQPCFVPGLLYVALTRCRSLDQITLNRPVSGFDCRLDPDVEWFYQDNNLQ